MGVIRDTAEKLWRGELSVQQQHPFIPTGDIEEVGAGVAFCRWFANFVACNTDDGLVLIDTGGYFNQQQTFAAVRRYSSARLNTAIYTHGHVDHACGLPPFLAEAAQNRTARPRVVGHRAVAARFDRYRTTTGYNNTINARQFSGPANFPTEYVYPDTYFDNQINVVVGSTHFECHHGRGETDDATWVYIPSAKVVATGDFFIWASPNAGNPQKVQRYAKDWADALRAMAKTGAEVLAPGHGSPIFGAQRVKQALNDTAEYLQSIHDQALALMNQGAALSDVIHSVKPSAELASKPYLQPIYDEPEFIVRNLWRLYGGWYDGVPSHLKPAPEATQAREIAELADGVENLAARAKLKMEAGDLAMASHLIDWAALAAPDNNLIHQLRAQIYMRRAEGASSTMSYGIFRSAARESAEKAGLKLPDTGRRF